jgi:hypothetical protein
LAEEPLLAIFEKNQYLDFEEIIPTAHCCRLFEYGRHLWVHLDSKIFLDHYLCVSGFDLFLDPVREAILENCGTHISQPLLRHFWQLKARLWQILVHLRVLVIEKLSYLFHSESVILWNVNCPD